MNSSESPIPQQRRLTPRRWELVALAIITLAVIVVRLRLRDMPLERDEGEYAYAGQLMLDGIPPYKLAYNMKLPGTYAGYAAIMAVFGQTASGIHLGFLLVNLATLALLFLVTRKLLDASHGIVACACYGLLSMCPGVMGLAAHATHLVVLGALGGWLLLLKAREKRRLPLFGWSGLVFGLAFVCKQQGAFFCLFALTVLGRDLIGAASTERRQWLKSIAVLGASMALPFGLTCLWMAGAGTFHRFWFWTVVYAQAHAGFVPWSAGWIDLKDFYEQAGALRWSWLVAAAGLICLIFDKTRRDAALVIGSLLAYSLAAFTTSYFFSPHYFIMVLPALSILAACLFRRLASFGGEMIPALSLGLACAGFIFAHRALWFEETPVAACRNIYGSNPFIEAVQIGKWLQEHTTPEESIAVLGSEPEIYFYAHRHSATGYIYMYDLMQPHQYASPMQKEAIQEIKRAKPAFLAQVSINESWTILPQSSRMILKWLDAYSGNYNTSGMIWISTNQTEYVWGDKVSEAKSDRPFDVCIMKRKPNLPAAADEAIDCVQLGTTAMDKKDFPQAFDWFRQAAEQGNAIGQRWLGIMYANGLAVEKDDVEALKWFRKAAENGDPAGQYLLGMGYAKGAGVDRDPVEAIKWIRKSAEQGEARGQALLAMAYEKGIGVEQDNALAAKWFRRAAERGNPKAQTALARLYEDGKGVEKSMAKAIAWYQRAAAQGEPEAQSKLARPKP